MNHYTAEQWADYVRHVGTPRDREQMREHLESGCAQCRETVAWLEKVAEMGRSQAAFNPPDEVLAGAVDLFEPEPRGLIRIPAFLVPQIPSGIQPAGVRSMAAYGVRLLYRAGDYSVDLKFEPRGGDNPVEVIGQITNEQDPQDQLGELDVQVVARGRTLAQAATNQFGEFIIEQPRRRSAVLRILLKRSGQLIDLPLQTEHS